MMSLVVTALRNHRVRLWGGKSSAMPVLCRTYAGELLMRLVGCRPWLRSSAMPTVELSSSSTASDALPVG